MVFQIETIYAIALGDEVFQSPMGMYGFSNSDSTSAPADGVAVSIPDGDVWFFKSCVALGDRSVALGFNPRWGCMVFQILPAKNLYLIKKPVSIPDGDVWFFKCGRDGNTAYSGLVSIPDGDVWFFKFIFLEAVGSHLTRVSIPDGDVWFFKSPVARQGQPLSNCFNPRWGCMVFQIHPPRATVAQSRGFNPRWGCMVFQIPAISPASGAWPSFNPRWGCMVFQIAGNDPA